MDKLPGIQEMPRPLLGGEQVASETSPRSKLFCCSCVRRWIPSVYREELLKVLHLTGPLLVSRILSFLLPFVTTIFCGHLGNAELAGYALASATINVTTAATGYGLSLACDTLVSQTFGSKNLKRVGEILQRSILILLLFCLPCWAILINTESILLSLRQEAEVARTAQLYVFAFLPAVPAMFLHQLQVAYLQNQGIILPQLYGAAVANILNVATNYVLIFWMDLGVKGSAASNSMSQIYNCLLLFVYIRWKKLHIKTWGGWSTASLQEWGSFMQLAIPSTLMLCFEWWIYEIGGFLAGMLGELDLAAQHILLELGAITYMFPLGVHTAACVRVGNELGAGDTTRALITSKVSLTLSGVLAVLQSIVLGSTKSVIGFIFTTDVKIVELVSETLNLYVFLQFFDALVCVSSGILLGAGKQKIAAIANLICYYCVGVPVGVSLMFAAEMRIFGLWLGLLICVIMQAGFFTTLIFKLNWQQLAEEAQRRAGKGRRMTCLAKPPIGEENVIESLVPENLGGLKLPLESVVIQAVIEGSKPPLCTPVSTQEQCKAGQEGGGTKTDLLSIDQLVLRRGLALLGCLLILATGVAAHIVFPPLDVPGPQPDNLTLGWGNITQGWDNSSSSILLFNNTYTSIQQTERAEALT